MTKNIFGLGKMLKTMGIEIKGFEKLFQNAETTIGKFKLKDGTLSHYETSKFGDQLVQTFEVGGKKIHFQTNFKEGLTVYSRKKGYIDIPKRETFAYVRENGQIPFAAKYEVTPLSAKQYKTPNGDINSRVSSLQELHSNQLMGPVVMPNDKLVGADGKLLRIYQRSPWMLSNNHGMLSL